MKSFPVRPLAILAGIIIAISHNSASCQTTPNAKQLSFCTSDCRWPSTNTLGAVVWSQQVSSHWQVFLFSKGVTTQITTDTAHNFEYPTIDDAGNITYLKDATGGGAGLSVVVNKSGVESTIEYSSGNPPGCTEPPAGPPTCTSWRTAGTHFGVSPVSGTTISYHDFISGGTTRTFDLSTGGSLPGNFLGWDFPDINQGQLLLFTVGPQVLLTSVQNPTTAQHTFPNPGAPTPALGRLNDNNNVLIVTGDLATTGQVTLYTPPLYDEQSAWHVGAGIWADVNNSSLVVFEALDSNSVHQVYSASFKGIDSSTSPSWSTIQSNYFYPQFLIQRIGTCGNTDSTGWNSLDEAPAGVAKAGYVFFDQDVSAQTMISRALAGSGGNPNLNFIAFDVECDNSSGCSAQTCTNLSNSTARQRRQTIWQAVKAIRQNGFKPVLYAAESWQQVAGELTEFHDVGLWLASGCGATNPGWKPIGTQTDCTVDSIVNADFDTFTFAPFNAALYPAEIAAALSQPTGTLTVGSTLTFSVETSNSGPNNATNLTLTITLPAGLTYVPGSAERSAPGARLRSVPSTRNSSSVMSASVIVSPMFFAFRMRKHRRTRAPFGVSIASSSRFFGQPGPWLTSMAFQSAPQAGQPSNSVCDEYPHFRQRKMRSGQSSSRPHSPPWCSTDRIRNRTPGSSGQSPGAAIPGLRRPRWPVAQSPRTPPPTCERSGRRWRSRRARCAACRRGHRSASFEQTTPHARPACWPTARSPGPKELA
jgi:uncharacterized repeat protein (TIGR01451 family)